jgi:replicative DNA helicase
MAERIPDPVPLGSVAVDMITSDPPIVVPTGLSVLDELIVGLACGDLTIIAGSPSQGKTALGMQIAEHAAANGVAVGIFSLEMSPAALSLRQLAAHSGVSAQRLRRRNMAPLTDAETAAVNEAAAYLQQLPLFVDTRSGLTGEQVYATVEGWVSRGIQLVLLDYIQLMEGHNDNRQEAVGRNVRLLKAAARDHGIPFIALSQVSRAVHMRDDKKPRMSDLRDSGQIEQVGDTIIMFHYPNVEDQFDEVRECDLHVVKQRQGPVGVVEVQFHRPTTRFMERNHDAKQA